MDIIHIFTPQKIHNITGEMRNIPIMYKYTFMGVEIKMISLIPMMVKVRMKFSTYFKEDI